MNVNTFQLVLLLAIRSFWDHRIKNLVVGLIVFFGVFLLVSTGAMLDSINRAMESSITESITGHLQIYDENAEDKLSMMGLAGNFLSKPHIGHISDFHTVRSLVERHPNVKAVVPMGTDATIVYSGNSMDRAVLVFRQGYALLPSRMSESEKRLAMAENILVIKRIFIHIREEYERMRGFSAGQQYVNDAFDVLDKVQGSQFWQYFFVDVSASLLFLETHVAPLIDDEHPVFMEVIGTDLQRFKENFSRFKVVKGEMVPAGRRGVLINDEQYEKVIKDRIARVFDHVWEKRTVENIYIKDERKIRDYIERRAREYKQWILSFDSHAAKKIEQTLQVFLNDRDAGLDALIAEFLALDDDNFLERYDFFYQNIAPQLKLYPFDIGDTITLKKFGQGASQNVIFYGTYQFDGVEKSGFSALFHLVDMMTFRELYGFITDEKRAQISLLKEEFTALEWARDTVEEELFNESVDFEGNSGGQGERGILDLNADNSEYELDERDLLARKEAQLRSHFHEYSQQEIDKGPVISASVVLNDVRQLAETQKDLARMLKDEKIPVQITDWQEASGYVGQMINVMKIVLLVFMVFVFCVSMVVVNNAMLMSTMNRYAEIGTLRAIGAGRGVIVAVFLTETIILTMIASVLGILAGVALIEYLGVIGIPAPRFEFQFLFGGRRLYPFIEMSHLYFGPFIILLISIAATFYPALLATRVSPVVAMNAGE